MKALEIASIQTLKVIPGISEKTAAHIKDFRHWQDADKTLEVTEKLQANIVTYRDPLYPNKLLNIYDFPVFLYARGFPREDDTNIAVVGSRMATTYGKFSTERLCRELA